MKREIILLLLAVLCLTGCGREDNPYRVDTVIQIPVDPTETPTEPEITQTPTEPEAEPAEETQTPTEKAPSTKKSTGSASGKSTGKSSETGKKGSEKNNKKETTSDNTKETKPAQEQTDPAGTTPPVTEPSTTQPPPTTQPPATEPPETTPPETAPPEPSYDPSGYSVGSLEYGVLEQINSYREEAGVPPLVMDENLCAVASVRAYETSILWSHTRPDGRGYASVLTDYGYASSGAAEHLAHVSGNGDAARIVSKWMNTEKNQESLLDGGRSAAGIGVYRSGGVTHLACLLIG